MSEISVILNVYKRPDTLEKQIEAVLNQSIKIKPENIHVWYNKSDKPQAMPKNKNIKTYSCNWNTKFWGRFTIPLLCQTEYIAMFDDDLLPEKDWFKNCLDSMKKQEGIYGGSGVLLKSNNYIPNQKVGWNGVQSNNIERVDLVGHAWFFKQEWSKYIFYDKPHTWDNGEDILFAYAAQKYGGINSYVPPHPSNNKSLWSTNHGFASTIGSDANSSWKIGNHLTLRNDVAKDCIKKGWSIVINEKK